MLPPNAFEQRKFERHMLKWKAAIVFERAGIRTVIHGTTQDVSIMGTAVLTDRNTGLPEKVTVYLAVPPRKVSDPKTVVEVACHMRSIVFSSNQNCFRVSYEFEKFMGNSRKVLESILSEYVV